MNIERVIKEEAALNCLPCTCASVWPAACDYSTRLFWALTWTINRIVINHKNIVENGQFLQPNEEWTAVQHKLTQKHHKICCWKIFGRV